MERIPDRANTATSSFYVSVIAQGWITNRARLQTTHLLKETTRGQRVALCAYTSIMEWAGPRMMSDLFGCCKWLPQWTNMSGTAHDPKARKFQSGRNSVLGVLLSPLPQIRRRKESQCSPSSLGCTAQLCRPGNIPYSQLSCGVTIHF